MKSRLTYKELTILFGILVAAIIFLIIWTQPSGTESSELGNSVSPKNILPATKLLIEKVHVIIQVLR